MYEKKERKYVAPEGYLYHKDGRYVEVVYPLTNQSINDYELVTIEEYEARMVAEEEERGKTNEA